VVLVTPHWRTAIVPVAILAGLVLIPRWFPPSGPEIGSAVAKRAASSQLRLRARLAEILRVDGRIKETRETPADSVVLSTAVVSSITQRWVEFQVRPGRRVKALVGIPAGVKNSRGGYPAIVAFHGHRDDGQDSDDGVDERLETFDPNSSVYHGFARGLTERGFVTIAVHVGYYSETEPGLTRTGLRLLDGIAAVDFLESLPFVDPSRIGTAGFSMGGMMAMWLGAMDERIAAVSSSGFLSEMRLMKGSHHCPCWEEKGLEGAVDFVDIYGLIAPRPLLIQIGGSLEFPAFVPEVAEPLVEKIRGFYLPFSCPEFVEKVLHEGGHVVEPESLYDFFERRLKPGS
jgi:hypothetical protein